MFSNVAVLTEVNAHLQTSADSELELTPSWGNENFHTNVVLYDRMVTTKPYHL